MINGVQLVVAALMLSCSLTVFAQRQAKPLKINNQIQIDKARVSAFDRNSLSKEDKFKRIERVKPMVMVQAMEKSDRPQVLQVNRQALSAAKSQLTVPELLIGTFKCKGISYWGGYVIGETVITADATDKNKIWIENLIPGNSNQKVYATIGNDQTTLSIPQNQIIYKEDALVAKLTVSGSAAAISGKFDPATGVITISTDLWGGKASDGWFELFRGATTYTRLDMLPPVAAYRQPQGGLFLGMDPDTWGGYSASCIVNSAYSRWNWKNTNLEEGVNYTWDYVNEQYDQKFSTDEDSLLLFVGDDYFSTPKLTATNGKGHSSSFVLGADYQNKNNESFAIAGGNAALIGFDANCDYSCANIDNGFTVLTAGADAYYYGTGASSFSDANYESLVVAYEKPQSTLYFEGVNVYLYVFEAPENTKFTMNIYKAEKNDKGFTKRGALLGSSTLLAKNVTTIKVDNQAVGYTMKFTDFEVKDEDGFFIKKEYFEVDDKILLELSGFNVDGVSLAVASEEIDPTDSDTRSLFTVKGDESFYSWNDKKQTMFFNLSGAVYSYINTSQKTIYASRNAASYDLDVVPYFDTLWVDNQPLPEWVKVDVVNEEYNESNWKAQVRVSLTALPESDSARYYSLEFRTTGASKTVLINQGGPVSVKEIKKAPTVFALKNNEGYLLKYPETMKELTMVSITGSVVGRYKLPAVGQYQLVNTELAEGIYLLKFSGGNTTESIKLVK
jgi:hypothetical protein